MLIDTIANAIGRGSGFMFGILDDLFDFNNNGKLDAMEQAVEVATITSIVDSNHDTVQTELELSGLDAYELEQMDEDERRVKRSNGRRWA